MSALNLDRILDGLLDLKGIGELRSVEWSRKYLWDVKFEAKGDLGTQLGQFGDFFPASDVEVLVANLDSLPFDLHLSAFKIPQKSEIKDISLTFYDDEAGTLFKWFSDWINLDILNNGQYISALLDDHKTIIADSFGKIRNVLPIRTLQIRRLDSMMKPISEDTYDVYPEGQLSFNGSSASEAMVYTMKFIIVGQVSKSKADLGGATTSLQFAKETLGRFI